MKIHSIEWKEWVDNLKVGDKVCYIDKSYYDKYIVDNYKISTIKHITPKKRRMTLESGIGFTNGVHCSGQFDPYIYLEIMSEHALRCSKLNEFSLKLSKACENEWIKFITTPEANQMLDIVNSLEGRSKKDENKKSEG